MKRGLRVLAASLVVLAVVGSGLFGCLLYAPAPDAPRLSGALTKGSLAVAGRARNYLVYLPPNLPPNAPLVMALHGSDGNAARMRVATGYGFERLADRHRFAVVYPEAYEGNWNACNITGDYSANTLNIDDVGFLTALAGKLIAERGIDSRRVFAVGISRGGSMAYRLALEAPSHFRAVAAAAANLPAAQNFKCRPAGGASSVMIMNGTDDPLNPFNGGEVSFLGIYNRGVVLSSRDSAAYFARRAGIATPPQADTARTPSGVETSLWRNEKTEVKLVTVIGGGHGMPQPWWRHPRILGPSPAEPNGPELVWNFFASQPALAAQR